jgi:DNA-binding Lrp family transcriptional regulator
VSYIDQIRPFLRGRPARCAAVLYALWARANPRDEAPVVWPSRELIAEDIGSGVSTVNRALRELEDAGAIERDGPRIHLARSVNPDRRSVNPDRSILTDDRSILHGRSVNPAPAIPIGTPKEHVAPSGSWAGVVQHANDLASRYDLAMIRDLATPPKGLIELLRQTDAESIKALLTEYAEICRAKPDQSRWWGRYMFTSSTWAAIEPMAIARRKAHQQAQGASLPTQNRSRVL